MLGFLAWTYVLFYMTQFANFCLKNIILYFPRNHIKKINYLLNDKSNVNIVSVRDNIGRDLTDKLQFYMNLFWDESLGQENGGVDLDDFAEIMKLSIMYIYYTVKDENSSSEFQTLIVDFKKKILTNYYAEGEEVDDLIFGEVFFKNLR